MTSWRFMLNSLAALVLVATAACQHAHEETAVPAKTLAAEPVVENEGAVHVTRAGEADVTLPAAAENLGSGMVDGAMMGGYGQWLTCESCHTPDGTNVTYAIREGRGGFEATR
ncbi:MAG: hypothetical protein ABI794_01175 [Betaproteobacteria bacterium]